MKTKNTLHKLIALAGSQLLALTSVNAAIVFNDDFETPVVEANSYFAQNTSTQIDPAKWVLSGSGFASNRSGIVHEDESIEGLTDEVAGPFFTDPVGSQAWAGRYDDNAGLTSAFQQIGAIAAGQTITVTFDAVVDGYLVENGGLFSGAPGNGSDLDAYLVLFDGASTRNDVRTFNNNTSAILASLTGNQGVTTSYQSFQFSYVVGDNVIDNNGAASGASTTWNPALLGHDIAIRFGENNNAIIDNVSVTIIPEPSTALLGGLSLLALLRRRR